MTSRVLKFLESKTLTIWLAGFFILYYLSVAVWSKEAFASFISLLRDNLLFQSAHVLLVANVSLRSGRAVIAQRRDLLRLALRLPLSVGVVLFLASFFLSLNIREDRRILVGEGDVVELPWESGPFRVAGVDPALDRRALRTNEAKIFDYEPGVTLIDGSGGQHHVGAFPPKRVRSSYLHVLNFGIGPGVRLRRGSEVLAEGFMALRLTPFGRVDSFELPPTPYTFYLSILPNRTITKGRETGRDYDLTKPLYRVEVTKGDVKISAAETDDAISFDGGMNLSFFTPSDWVLLEAAYDPVLPVFAFSLVMLVAGAVLYPVSFLGADSGARKTE
jgi:hypothetical protein